MTIFSEEMLIFNIRRRGLMPNLIKKSWTVSRPDVSNRDFTLSSILFAGNNNASGTMIDDKSKQWFGASVHSSGQDGIIVVRFTFNFVYY